MLRRKVVLYALEREVHNERGTYDCAVFSKGPFISEEDNEKFDEMLQMAFEDGLPVRREYRLSIIVDEEDNLKDFFIESKSFTQCQWSPVDYFPKPLIFIVYNLAAENLEESVFDVPQIVWENTDEETKTDWRIVRSQNKSSDGAIDIDILIEKKVDDEWSLVLESEKLPPCICEFMAYNLRKNQDIQELTV